MHTNPKSHEFGFQLENKNLWNLLSPVHSFPLLVVDQMQSVFCGFKIYFLRFKSIEISELTFENCHVLISKQFVQDFVENSVKCLLLNATCNEQKYHSLTDICQFTPNIGYFVQTLRPIQERYCPTLTWRFKSRLLKPPNFSRMMFCLSYWELSPNKQITRNYLFLRTAHNWE